jgi:acyl-CoA synthetase (AMP-forming)/AMP-acid ligase II
MDFAALDLASNRVANALLAKGVSLNTRVGFLGKNSLDFYLALFGSVKTRGCFVPFNWRLSAQELAMQIADSTASIAFVDHESLELWNSACAIARLNVEAIIIGQGDAIDTLVDGCPAEPPDLRVSEEDAAIQLYTSGTTGRPKGVMLTHGGFNRVRLCEHLEPAYEWREGDIFINPLPNFHLLHIGIALQCLYNGVGVSLLRQFEPGVVLESIARERPTLLTLTPTMIQMLLDHPKAAQTDFSSLRLMLYAGSPISLGLIKRAVAMMPCRFMQFYGSTEANGAFSLLRPDEHNLDDENALQSCGRPLPLITFRILDSEGREVSDGEPGELVVRSPAIMAGYWAQPDATSAVLANGWYRTGDVARRDASGLYYIVDRIKDMIVSGGENIYSAEIENVLSTHPAVIAVAVIGVPDERWGEAVKAIVIRKQEISCTDVELTRYCRERLAAYKVPKSFDFVETLPLVSSGKVSKKDLRARYWSQHQRMIA